MIKSRIRSTYMGQQRKSPILEPVLESCNVGPPISFTRQASTQYKPHKYGAPPKLERRRTCVGLGFRPWRFFGRLRDRYIKAMNEMAMGGDFTAVAGFGTGAETDYTLQHCRSVKNREMEAMQEKSAALTRSKSQSAAATFRSSRFAV